MPAGLLKAAPTGSFLAARRGGAASSSAAQRAQHLQRHALALAPSPSARRTAARAAPGPRGRRAAVAVRADMWATVDTVVTGGALAVAAGAAILAVLADRRPEREVREQQDNGFKWGLMGAISCLPLFNWMVSWSVCQRWLGGRREGDGQRCGRGREEGRDVVRLRHSRMNACVRPLRLPCPASSATPSPSASPPLHTQRHHH